MEQIVGTSHLIGSYKLEDISLGEGAFCKVRLATHIPTNEKVAIKIFSKQKLLEESNVYQFNRERKIGKLLNHINIVKLYDVNILIKTVETKDKIYLIMEYIEGGELYQKMVEKERLEEIEASFYFAQLVNSIEYCHRIGVVHRDLKPENLLITSKNILKLIDFGLSCVTTQGLMLSTACGTKCYSAPETIGGKPYSPYPVDIWSIGVILYVMVCGELPFKVND